MTTEWTIDDSSDPYVNFTSPEGTTVGPDEIVGILNAYRAALIEIAAIDQDYVPNWERATKEGVRLAITALAQGQRVVPAHGEHRQYR